MRNVGETLGPSSLPLAAHWIRQQLVQQGDLVAYKVQRGWTDWREFPRWSGAPLKADLAGVAVGGEEAL